jgi:hypothetical protein
LHNLESRYAELSRRLQSGRASTNPHLPSILIYFLRLAFALRYDPCLHPSRPVGRSNALKNDCPPLQQIRQFGQRASCFVIRYRV